jgi:hypothetical protein
MSAPYIRHPDRVLNAVRLELEAAGNPSYVVAVLDDDCHATLAPMTFARREPAASHARELDRQITEDVVVVGREEVARRALFTVFDATVSYKLYSRVEVVESTIAQDSAADAA